MRRTKQLQGMVDYVNKFLEFNRIKDIYDTTFMVMSDALIRGDIYKGFIWCRYVDSNGNYQMCKEEDADFIKLL